MKGQKDIEIEKLRRELARERTHSTELHEEKEHRLSQARAFAQACRRWRRVAVVAVLACPGSFVAGGYLLHRLLVAWG